MKLKIEKANLVNGVNTVIKAVPAKTTMHILTCIVIDATESKIKLSATDLSLGIETLVEGTIEEKGSIAIDAKTFAEIAKKMPDQEITLDVDEEKLAVTVKAGKAKFKIAGVKSEDFPGIPMIAADNKVKISELAFKEGIRQTIFSIADNESNKIMTGENLIVHENELRLESLDGHRIAVRKVTLKENYPDMSAVIPGKTLSEVGKILGGDAEKDITLSFDDSSVAFIFDQTKVTSRLIDGEFFKINQLINGDYETKIKVNRQAYMDCIDRSTLMIKEGDRKPLIMDIHPDGIMNVKMSAVMGSMDEEIEIEGAGKELVIGFNPRFLLDALRVIDDENVELYMTNRKAPVLIKDKDETYTYLILPVNF